MVSRRAVQHLVNHLQFNEMIATARGAQAGIADQAFAIEPGFGRISAGAGSVSGCRLV